MQLYALGLNHESAALPLREKLAFSNEHLETALNELHEQYQLQEIAILSTCNRTELYFHSNDASAQSAYAVVTPWLAKRGGISMQQLESGLYRFPNEGAVKHVFRVAAGLDSMVLGEPQILGQMKSAFSIANNVGTTGQLLNRLFQRTFAVAKRVRSDTGVGDNAISVAYAGVSLAKRVFTDLSQQTALLVGAGETIELVAQHLKRQGVKRMIIANRSAQRATLLADSIGDGVDVIQLGEIPDYISQADIVVSSTASSLPILGTGMINQALKKRQHRPMFMLDLAVPRDIEDAVGKLRNVYLYTVDDLKHVVNENRMRRQQEAQAAENIIDIEVVRFMRWIRALNAVPDIKSLRDQFEKTRQQELEKALGHLNNGVAPEEVLQYLSHNLTNKLSHKPTHALRKANIDGDQKLLQSARQFFDFE